MADRQQQTYSIGEVADLVGMSVHALRFYEREQLLVGQVARTSGGLRRYTQVDIDWLHVCTRLRESGMPLTELQRFAALARQGPGNEEQRLALLDAHRQRVDNQIDALQQAREIITWKTSVYQELLSHGDTTNLWDHFPTNRTRNN